MLGRRGTRRRSVLIVTAEPDDRPSTRALEDLVSILDDAPDVRVSLWYLRRGTRPPRPGARIVDDLRHSALPAAVERAGAARLAAALRGLEMRAWYVALRPDVVVLDDGLGERVLLRRARPLVVVRSNEERPASADLEPAPRGADARVVLGARGDTPEGAWWQELVPLGVAPDPAAGGIPREPRLVRSTFGLPTEGPLVVTWPAGGRAAAAAVDALAVSGPGDSFPLLVLDPSCDPGTASSLRSRAEAAGVGHLVHLRSADIPDLRLAADILLLDEAQVDRTLVADAARAGVQIVTLRRPEPSPAELVARILNASVMRPAPPTSH